MLLSRRSPLVLVVAAVIAGCATQPAPPEPKPDTQNAMPKEIVLPPKEPLAAQPSQTPPPSPPAKTPPSVEEPSVGTHSEPPDLLFNLDGEAYGYWIGTTRLSPLSASGGTAEELAVSADGRRVAYVKDGGKYSPFHAVCVRNTTGGAAICRAEEIAKENFQLTWEPGSSRLVISNLKGVFAYEVHANSLKPVPGIGKTVIWSPDGAWYVEADARSKWLVSVKAPGERKPLPPGAGVVEWVGSNLLAVVVEEPKGTGFHDRRNRLVLVDLTGKVTDTPKLEDGELITSLIPDPQGRFLAVNTSVQFSVLKPWSEYLYEIKGGKWLSIPAKELARLTGWIGGGQLVGLGQGDSWILLEPATNKVTPLKPEPQGAYAGSSPNGEWLAFLKRGAKTDWGESMSLYHLPTQTIKPIPLEGKWIREVLWVSRR